MASSKPRGSCSFINLLLSFFNFILFILSAASLAPIISLKMPPTSFGWAFIMVSCISLLSSFIGFYSQLANICCITHVSLLIASSTGQLLGILALFTKEKSSISMLKSNRDPREAKLLVRLECGVLMAMFVMQFGVLLLTCCVHSCWVREYEDLEAEKEATTKKRRQKIARVQEESMANAAKIAELKGKEFDEKMKNKPTDLPIKTQSSDEGQLKSTQINLKRQRSINVVSSSEAATSPSFSFNRNGPDHIF
ncbi:hypothetical protein BUALT_Bualt09G0041100 [Buddleja alternifolia]|uniref:Membrane lipoprotein n=1 Tax=Buddleja alternifolia TaxID=168488 RepID=A0AAV6X6I4_9LAMI|nr:hypothetical protein BUALT_Bualt09G0041100 [Buddleja alternifolia]